MELQNNLAKGTKVTFGVDGLNFKKYFGPFAPFWTAHVKLQAAAKRIFSKKGITNGRPNIDAVSVKKVAEDGSNTKKNPRAGE